MKIFMLDKAASCIGYLCVNKTSVHLTNRMLFSLAQPLQILITQHEDLHRILFGSLLEAVVATDAIGNCSAEL